MNDSKKHTVEEVRLMKGNEAIAHAAVRNCPIRNGRIIARNSGFDSLFYK